MATVKTVSVTEQNANTIAGVQVDTAVYVGTGAAGVPSLKWGREAPVYEMTGTQTAVTLNIVLDTANAYQGAQFNIRGGTGVAFGTSIVQIVNATTGGTVVSTSSGVKNIFATFDGTQWR